MERRELYREILRNAGLDALRADAGSLVAIRAGRVGVAMVSCHLRAFVRDLSTWSLDRASSFLACHDNGFTTLSRGY